MTYREQGERPALDPSLRRWFTKQGDAEKGPYDEAALVRAVKRGMLSARTLVRAEDQTEWRPLADVEQLAKKTAPKPLGRQNAAFDPERDIHPDARGDFGLGLAAGLLGGCIGLVLVEALAKGNETKRGARFGFLAQLVIGVSLRVLASTLAP
jgi:hypothetical protein